MQEFIKGAQVVYNGLKSQIRCFNCRSIKLIFEVSRIWEKANLRQFQPFEVLIKENQASMFLNRVI
jgi:hypothetical protein